MKEKTLTILKDINVPEPVKSVVLKELPHVKINDNEQFYCTKNGLVVSEVISYSENHHLPEMHISTINEQTGKRTKLITNLVPDKNLISVNNNGDIFYIDFVNKTDVCRIKFPYNESIAYDKENIVLKIDPDSTWKIPQFDDNIFIEYTSEGLFYQHNLISKEKKFLGGIDPDTFIPGRFDMGATAQWYPDSKGNEIIIRVTQDFYKFNKKKDIIPFNRLFGIRYQSKVGPNNNIFILEDVHEENSLYIFKDKMNLLVANGGRWKQWNVNEKGEVLMTTNQNKMYKITLPQKS